jgi:hypothetical protein
VVPRRGAKTVCARGADQALLRGRSASPLDSMQDRIAEVDAKWFRISRVLSEGQCAERYVLRSK